MTDKPAHPLSNAQPASVLGDSPSSNTSTSPADLLTADNTSVTTTSTTTSSRSLARIVRPKELTVTEIRKHHNEIYHFSGHRNWYKGVTVRRQGGFGELVVLDYLYSDVTTYALKTLLKKDDDIPNLTRNAHIKRIHYQATSYFLPQTHALKLQRTERKQIKQPQQRSNRKRKK